MGINRYVPRSSDDGDRVQAKELVGHVLIVNVCDVRQGIVTQYKKAGGTAVVLAIHDVDTGITYRDVLWMNNQCVDALSPIKGLGSFGIKLGIRKANTSGNEYIVVEELNDSDEERAAAAESTLQEAWWVLDAAPAASEDPNAGWDEKPAPAAAPKPLGATKTAAAAEAPNDVDKAKALLGSGLDIPTVAKALGLTVAVVTAIANL